MGVKPVGKVGEKSTFALSSVFGKQIMGEFRQQSATEIQENSGFLARVSAFGKLSVVSCQ
ncbi:MAG: hypothetical protein ACOYIS_07025 [Candidatus Cloacimonadaceae bacterium]|jgi:hypothetical protein